MKQVAWIVSTQTIRTNGPILESLHILLSGSYV